MAVAVTVVSIYEYLKAIFLFRYKLSSGRMTKNEEFERNMNMVAARFKIISHNLRGLIRKTVRA
jgi:hypothetical protein